MPVGAVILVETGLPGNLGGAVRVAANFGVNRLELVRPAVDPMDSEVVRWACGGHDHLEIAVHSSFAAAAADYRTLVASASGRGRDNQPVVTPDELAEYLEQHGLQHAALVFGNESSGLRRDHLDRCDLVVRVPTQPEFPVLNLTQAVAVVLAGLKMRLEPAPTGTREPAEQHEVEALMAHLRSSLLGIGFLDPASPDRILRKLRRLFGRAAITENEVAILRGMCRQMEWAARTAPLAGGRWDQGEGSADEDE